MLPSIANMDPRFGVCPSEPWLSTSFSTPLLDCQSAQPSSPSYSYSPSFSPLPKHSSTTLPPDYQPWLLFHLDINPKTSIFSSVFLTATLFQLLAFYLAQRYIPGLAHFNIKDRRRLSWVLTLLSSMVLFTGTFTLSRGIQMTRPWFLGGDGPTFLSMAHFPCESGWATFYSAYFTSYLLCDLGLGLVFYRGQLDPLSGWAHHLGYLVVVSKVAQQQHLSTLFAMGTPIEFSTLFLGTGHIFPSLRSDSMFAVSFFLSRILYPIVLLPEIYCNVDSTLCWKVGLMALTIHLYWFQKFIQQQLRYRQARSSLAVMTQSAVQEIKTSIVLKERQAHEKDPKDVPFMLHLKKDLVSRLVAEERNEIAGQGDQKNQMEVNGSHGRRVTFKDHRRSSYIYAQDIFSKDKDTPAAASTEPSIQDLLLLQQETISKANEQDNFQVDEPTSLSPLRTKHVRESSKTMSSVLVLKNLDLNDHYQNDNNDDGGDLSGRKGAVRIRRASSMRDSKKRISLSSIQFEDPKHISFTPIPRHAPVPAPLSLYAHIKDNDQDAWDDGSATVIVRKRPSRASVSVAAAATAAADQPSFDTIRLNNVRRVAVNA